MDRLLSMRVFQTVVDEGGFAAAARALDMSPAVITRLVADLEDHLGARLLQRTTRRQALTDAGERYLERLRAILLDLEEANAEAKASSQQLSGTLHIHAPPVLASYVLSPMLAEFRQRYPKILLDIHVDALPDPPVEDYDVALVGVNANTDLEWVARKIVESEAILVASPDYLRRHGQPQSPQDLARHDCLRLKMPGDHQPRTWVLWPESEPAQRIELPLQPVMWANHSDTLLRAALDGAGITSVSLDLVAPALTRGELVRVLAPWITGRLVLYAALPSRKFVPQRTRVFLDFLVERVKQQSQSALQACQVC